MRSACIRSFATLALLVITSILSFDFRIAQACTTAVISGKATIDGRPLLWKNRDTSSTAHNEVALFTQGRYRAIGIVNAGSRTSIWMGANEAGFCIENSLSRDLKGSEKSQGPGNGGFMKLALETCATVDDFRALLEKTNVDGRSTIANFGVIDAQGGAVLFETGPKTFTMFDANDPMVAPAGYVVRSNFSTTAQDLPATPAAAQLESIYAGERFLRACELIESRRSEKVSLDYVLRNMCRDLSDGQGHAFPGSVNGLQSPLPTVIPTDHTISRTTTVSAAVFHGVRPGENPALTTMWAILGDPKFSIAVPCWVAVEEIADPLADERGAELGEIAITLRDWNLTQDRSGVRTEGLPGIWQDVWPAEDQILGDTRLMRESWSARGFTPQAMTSFHTAVSMRAMAVMERELRQSKEAAIASTSTSDIHSTDAKIRVAIYDHSTGTANGPKNLLRFLTMETGFDCQRVRPEDIQAGSLESFQVLIVPGGSGSQQAEKLEDHGREAIRKFVTGGGGYVGICAGSYLASSQYSWSLGLINARVWDRAHWARGTGTVSIGLTPSGAELFESEQPTVDLYYGQGPLLVPGDFPDLPNYEVLAAYTTEIAAKGAPVGAMLGTHAIVRGEFGQGRVLCFSPHPETQDGPNDLISQGIRWAADVPAE